MANESPNILNYSLLKGSVFFKRSGESQRRHMGNVAELEWQPELEKLEHFQSMSGTRERDRTIILEKKGSVRLVFEELTPENMALAFLGTTSTESGGDVEIAIFSVSEIAGELWYEGANDIGPKYNAYFPSVSVIPSGGVPFISDDWAQVELTIDVNKSGDNFGYITKVADGA
jgi:hypothetical protein